MNYNHEIFGKFFGIKKEEEPEEEMGWFEKKHGYKCDNPFEIRDKTPLNWFDKLVRWADTDREVMAFLLYFIFMGVLLNVMLLVIACAR